MDAQQHQQEQAALAGANGLNVTPVQVQGEYTFTDRELQDVLGFLEVTNAYRKPQDQTVQDNWSMEPVLLPSTSTPADCRDEQQLNQFGELPQQPSLAIPPISAGGLQFQPRLLNTSGAATPPPPPGHFEQPNNGYSNMPMPYQQQQQQQAMSQQQQAMSQQQQAAMNQFLMKAQAQQAYDQQVMASGNGDLPMQFHNNQGQPGPMSVPMANPQQLQFVNFNQVGKGPMMGPRGPPAGPPDQQHPQPPPQQRQPGPAPGSMAPIMHMQMMPDEAIMDIKPNINGNGAMPANMPQQAGMGGPGMKSVGPGPAQTPAQQAAMQAAMQAAIMGQDSQALNNKVSHGASEKQRRDRINSMIDQLRALVPIRGIRTPAGAEINSAASEGVDSSFSVEGRRSKFIVLAETIQMITSMKAELEEKDKAHAKMVAELQELRKFKEDAVKSSEGGGPESSKGTSGVSSGSSPRAARLRTSSGGTKDAAMEEELAAAEEIAGSSPTHSASVSEDTSNSGGMGGEGTASSGRRASPSGCMMPPRPPDSADAHEMPEEGVVVDMGPDHCFIKVTCQDRRGLLGDILNCFKSLPLEVVRAAITTRNGMVTDIFDVKVYEGCALSGDDIKTKVYEGMLSADANIFAGEKRRRGDSD